MRLQECYIENFGCLHQFSYQFTEPLTTIMESNGWGKSTLAVFLRSMFYGLPNVRNHKLDENERKKYSPWSGGKMGGYVIFEVNGKQYRMERSFEKREKDDTFVLYDQVSGLISNDFSEKIGEELFGIDLDAYSKSAYISQNAIEFGTNDSMNAKLGNLLDSNDDINNFDQAIKKLNEARKYYKKTGKKGSIAEAEQKIAELKIKLEKKEANQNSILERQEQQRSITEKKEKLDDQIQETKKQIQIASRQEANREKKKRYDDIQLSVQELCEELKNESAFFVNGVPTSEQIQECKENIQKINEAVGARDSYKLNPEEISLLALFEQKIALGIFSEETLHQMEEKERKNREIRILINEGELSAEEQKIKSEGELLFREEIPSREQISYYSKAIAEQNHLQQKLRQEELTGGTTEGRSKRPMKGALLVSVLIAVLGMLSYFWITPLLGGILMAIGVLAAVTSGILLVIQTKQNNTKQQSQIEKTERELKEMQQKLDAFIGMYILPTDRKEPFEDLMEIERMRAEYIRVIEKQKRNNTEELRATLHSNQERLLQFLESMEVKTANITNSFENEIALLRDQYRYFCDLLEKRRQEMKNEEQMKDYQAKIDRFLGRYTFASHLTYGEKIEVLHEKINTNTRLKKEVKVLEEKLHSLEETEDFKEWSLEKSIEGDLLTLQDKERELEEQKESLRQSEKDIETAMDALLENHDELLENEQEMVLLEEQMAKDRKRCEIIEETSKYLLEAKESFSKHYMKGFRGAFEQYIEKIASVDLAGARIDANMEVQVNTQGALRELDFFSRGNKDLVNVCARFALIDALFEEEKPFVILDDTFVNLDQERLDQVLKLLKQISSNIQIIYFVCHESRLA